MKYDYASWHYGGNFPADLPPEAGAVHIAMFVVWAWQNGLAGTLHIDEFPEDLERVRQRQDTPAALFIRMCDEKFTSEDLNDEGNAFAADFYGRDGKLNGESDGYVEIYAGLFPDLPSSYHVPDSWQSYDVVAAAVSRRFAEWREERF